MHEIGLAAGSLAASTAGFVGVGAAWLAARRRRRLRLGGRAPEFADLRGADGRRHALSDFAKGNAVAIVFTTNRCPGAKAYDGRLRALLETFGPRGFEIVALNPADERAYPGEGLDGMRAAVRARGLTYPYLKDTRAAVAAAYGAVCTPEVFLLDRARRLRYRGRIDDAFVERRVRSTYLRNALVEVLEGKRVTIPETAPLGCSVS